MASYPKGSAEPEIWRNDQNKHQYGEAGQDDGNGFVRHAATLGPERDRASVYFCFQTPDSSM